MNLWSDAICKLYRCWMTSKMRCNSLLECTGTCMMRLLTIVILAKGYIIAGMWRFVSGMMQLLMSIYTLGNSHVVRPCCAQCNCLYLELLERGPYLTYCAPLCVQVGLKVMAGWFVHFTMLVVYTLAHVLLSPLRRFTTNYYVHR